MLWSAQLPFWIEFQARENVRPKASNAPANLEGATCCPNWPVGIEKECDAACAFEAEKGSSEV